MEILLKLTESTNKINYAERSTATLVKNRVGCPKKAIKEIGVDGLIVVDLPPEADRELCIPANESGIDFIRLATPTSSEDRLPKIVNNASGFLYYVSVAGITGSKAPEISSIERKIKIIRNFTNIPIAVGFGIKTPEQAFNISKIADAVVVGSAIIDKIKEAY